MTSLATQETAARTAAAWSPLKDWTIVEMTGPERQKFLHSFCTQDIKGMPADSVREAFVTNVKGRIFGHLLVLNEADRLTLLSVPGTAAVLVRHLQMYLLGLDAEVRDVSAERSALCLMGPAAVSAVSAKGIALPNELNSLQTQTTPLGDVTAAQVDLLSVPAWLLLMPTDATGDTEQSLSQAGVVQVDHAVFDLLRIEAGFPWHGRDLSEDHIAQEAARTERNISFTKGCYLGQEPIARLDAMGHTNRELRTVRIAGQQTLPLNSEVQVDGASIGTLTSIAASDTHGDTVAMGVLKVKHAKPGATVQVLTPAGQPLTGHVCWPTIER